MSIKDQIKVPEDSVKTKHRMGNAALPLHDGGFANRLFSGLENGKGTLQKGWTDLDFEREFVAGQTKSQPNANICMRMGNGLGGLDIDFDNPVAAAAARAVAIERFGRDVPLRSTTGVATGFFFCIVMVTIQVFAQR